MLFLDFLKEDNGDLWIATEGGGLIFREFSRKRNKVIYFMKIEMAWFIIM